MLSSDKQSHSESDQHKNKHKKIWCDDCNKYIADGKRHFQSEIHRQNSFANNTSVTSGLATSGLVTSGLVINLRTFIKYKITTIINLEQKVKEILSQRLYLLNLKPKLGIQQCLLN